MKFTKTMLVASLAAATGFAYAESQVTIYGAVDGTIMVSKPKGESANVALEDGVAGGSFWGITGSEDLGGGAEIGFTLENAFSFDTGSTDIVGKTFSKQATLELSSDYGLIAFGRMGGLASYEGSYSIWDASPFGNDFGPAALDSVFFTGQIFNNAILIQTPDINGLKIHFQFSNSGDLDDADDNTDKFSRNDHYYGLGLTYEVGALSLALIAEANTYGYAKYASDDKVKNSYIYSLSATYDFDVAKAYFGYQYAQGIHKILESTFGYEMFIAGKGARQHAFSLGADVPLAGGTLKAGSYYGWGKIRQTNVYASDGDTWEGPETLDKAKYSRLTLGLGYEYPLSKRTAAYTYGAWTKGFQDISDVPEANVWAIGIGLVHNF